VGEAAADRRLDVDQLVFSGGGTRCFWHGGFMKVVAPALVKRPELIRGVSGGALSASAFIAGREETLLERMTVAFRRVDHNVRLHKIDEAEGITPHQRLYREVVSDTLDRDAIEAIAEGPPFEVLVSHPPSDRLPMLSTFPVMAAYQVELLLFSSPHISWPQRLGLREEVIDARQAARDGDLVELLMHAASIPPIFGVTAWNGRPCIDGGMASKAPVPQEEGGSALVLLTRQMKNVPRVDGRVYVMPSHATPADKIDFTDPEKVERTWSLGEKDGHRFLTDPQTRRIAA
jgi:hypothetical protein